MADEVSALRGCVGRIIGELEDLTLQIDSGKIPTVCPGLQIEIKPGMDIRKLNSYMKSVSDLAELRDDIERLYKAHIRNG